MKEIQKDILPFEKDFFFSPLRNKVDYAWLIIHAARVLLLDYDAGGEEIHDRMKLVIDKMSRLFFYSSDKHFSVSFPFTISSNEEQGLEITSYSGKTVDHHNISVVVSILQDEQFKLNPSPIEFYMDAEPEATEGVLLLEEIFQFEPAYIRYDHDPDHENGKLHPLHHLDVNYASYGTYKLGLNEALVDANFENLLNIKTECTFLSGQS